MKRPASVRWRVNTAVTGITGWVGCLVAGSLHPALGWVIGIWLCVLLVLVAAATPVRRGTWLGREPVDKEHTCRKPWLMLWVREGQRWRCDTCGMRWRVQVDWSWGDTIKYWQADEDGDPQ